MPTLPSPRLAAPLLCLLAAPAALDGGPAEAQTGEAVMEKAVEAYEQRIRDIRSYTVTQRVDVMGRAVTHRFVKRTEGGHPVFVPAADSADGRRPRGWGNPYQIFLRMSDRARLQGRDSLEGRPVWTVSVTDFTGVDVDRMTPAGARGRFRPGKATFQLDAETFVIRRVVLEGAMEAGGESKPLSMTARFSDYRERGGMLYPFRTVYTVEGMDAVMSEEQRNQARRQLRRLRSKLDSLDEAERRRAESALGAKLEQLERTVESNRLDVRIEVEELTVDQGPADGG